MSDGKSTGVDMGIAVRSSLAGIALCVLAACGGGGGGGGGPTVNPINPGTGGTYTPGVFAPRADFAAQCISPRAGTNDRTGSAFTEKMFLRSFTNELYLWYNEVPDTNPNSVPDVIDYFDTLTTPQLTPSNQPKDRFHFTFDTNDWIALSQGGQEIGYGAEIMILGDGRPPRRAIVAFTDPGTPAGNGGVTRGMEVVSINGVDFVNDNTQAGIDILNAAFFPSTTGSTFTWVFKRPDTTTLSVPLTSANITHQPVLLDATIGMNGDLIGYMVFNDHIGIAEDQLFDAITRLQGAGVDDLILDLRYNGGGFLDLASELAFMIAGPAKTTGQIFERLVFNNKNPTRDPITGELLATGTPFHSTVQGLPGSSKTPGTPLPTLGLDRVYVITGPGTCSASESIINSLRGVNVQVFLIGSTTCGKPFGFYPQENCGTTYFSIQFQGLNAMGEGNYPDGFAANNQTGPNSIKLPGCSVADDLTHQLGETNEGRLKAALDFRASGNTTCPTASGFAPGTQLKPGQTSLSTTDGKIFKSPLRENRILRNH
jgi:carboxyl-terminal processing protease